MKKKPYYLKFYKECMVIGGWMPDAGLCLCFDDMPQASKELKLFAPTRIDEHTFTDSINVDWEGAPNYWGSGTIHGEWMKFTTLRQTIVLFLAAMNDEL